MPIPETKPSTTGQRTVNSACQQTLPPDTMSVEPAHAHSAALSPPPNYPPTSCERYVSIQLIAVSATYNVSLCGNDRRHSLSGDRLPLPTDRLGRHRALAHGAMPQLHRGQLAQPLNAVKACPLVLAQVPRSHNQLLPVDLRAWFSVRRLASQRCQNALSDRRARMRSLPWA